MFTFHVALALASLPGHVPVQGVLHGGDGVAVVGTRSVTFALLDASDAVVHTETQVLLFEGGTFATQLGVATTLDLELFQQDLRLTVSVAGDAASAPVDVGWAPRAGWAANAGRLGGELPAAYVTWADGYLPGAGLSLTGRTFAFDTALLPTEGMVEGWITNGAINLASGSTLNGASLAPLSESTVESYITNGAINLAPGSTLNGVSLAPLSEATVESYVTNGALNLASGTTINAGVPMVRSEFSLLRCAKQFGSASGGDINQNFTWTAGECGGTAPTASHIPLLEYFSCGCGDLKILQPTGAANVFLRYDGCGVAELRMTYLKAF